MTSALQLTLSNPAAIEPLPRGTGHYVAALQTKAGELTALREASAKTWAALTPLMEVLGPRTPGTKPFTRNRIDGWAKRLAAATPSIWTDCGFRRTIPPMAPVDRCRR